MKYCSNCDKTIDDESQLFCMTCGKPLEEKNICPKCHTEYAADDAFCIKCGAPLKKPSYTPEKEPPLEQKPPINNNGSNDRTRLIAVIAIAVLVIAGVAFYFLGNSQKNTIATNIPESTDNQPQIEKPKPPIPPAVPTSPMPNKPAPTPTFPQITHTAIVNATHSSADQEGNYIHSASLAIDGDIKTCWSEGVPGLGFGEYIIINFNGTHTVSGMNIWIGHQKSLDLFYQNARPVTIRVVGSDGSNNIYNLADSFGAQHINFAHPINVQYLKLIVEGVSPGNKYKDTCIAEVNFF